MEAAKIVSDAIAALPATPTVDDIGTIRSAEEAYNKLTDDQKGYLTQREVDKLTNAVSTVSTLEVGCVWPDRSTPRKGRCDRTGSCSN